MKEIVVFDLDGVLRDPSHRAGLAPVFGRDKTANWHQYNMASIADSPIPANLELLTGLSRLFDVRILSSCCTDARQIAFDFLNDEGCSYDTLTMRLPDDNRSAADFKEAMLREWGVDRIVCCFDDDPEVVARIRSMGIVCHQVARCYNDIVDGRVLLPSEYSIGDNEDDPSYHNVQMMLADDVKEALTAANVPWESK